MRWEGRKLTERGKSPDADKLESIGGTLSSMDQLSALSTS